MLAHIKDQTVSFNDKCKNMINTTSNKEFSASNKIVGRLTGQNDGCKVDDDSHSKSERCVKKKRSLKKCLLHMGEICPRVCMCVCLRSSMCSKDFLLPPQNVNRSFEL